MKKRFYVLLLLLLPVFVPATAQQRPNILIAISDDQSFPYASAYGDVGVRTPAFDRVAKEGVLFTNAIVASPGCSPSRAAFLTGRFPWQIESAGTHASDFPTRYTVFPDLLEKAGYHIGMTGKGWGPGDWQASGRTRNPAGPEYSKIKTKPPYGGISSSDYAANFEAFLAEKKEGQPFYFWYGASEPHRTYEVGAGIKAGIDPKKLHLPAFLPDHPEVRSDIADYANEIQWFDRHLERMLDLLEKRGELDNTIVIVTADNGMSFPRAKANAYEYGIHVPLAIRWGARVAGGRHIDDVVSLVDITPVLAEAAGVKLPAGQAFSGRSIMSMLRSGKSGVLEPGRVAFSGRERHSSSRADNLGYPQRAIRTDRYLYIRNFKPERWPAGDPQDMTKDGPGPMHGGYHDIDGAPTLEYMVANVSTPAVARFLKLAVDKRPAEELFDVKADPACLENLAGRENMAAVLADLRARLVTRLRETGDPRVVGNGDVWESYPRLSGSIRNFAPVPPDATFDTLPR